MDMMTIRKMVMAQMASGAQFIKGSFTIPSEGSTYTLNFGKTFLKYLFVVEADDNSKETIADSTSMTNQRAFQIFGIYPNPVINNTAQTSSKLVSRITPSTGAVTGGGSSSHICSDTSIKFTIGDFETTNQNYLYKSLTYNYFVVEIK